MKHLAVAALTAATVLAVVAVYRGVSSGPNDSANPPADPTADVDRLQRELDAVRANVRHLDREQSSLDRGARSATREAGAGATEPAGYDEVPDMSPASDEDSAAALEVQVSMLEEALETGLDPEWSSWAEAELGALFGDDSTLDTTSVDIRCAGSLCRMELAFAAGESMDDVLQTLPTVMPWSAQGFFHIDAENHALVYVSREGAELPRAG